MPIIVCKLDRITLQFEYDKMDDLESFKNGRQIEERERANCRKCETVRVELESTFFFFWTV